VHLGECRFNAVAVAHFDDERCHRERLHGSNRLGTAFVVRGVRVPKNGNARDAGDNRRPLRTRSERQEPGTRNTAP
jgi:hypothetical protein